MQMFEFRLLGNILINIWKLNQDSWSNWKQNGCFYRFVFHFQKSIVTNKIRKRAKAANSFVPNFWGRKWHGCSFRRLFLTVSVSVPSPRMPRSVTFVFSQQAAAVFSSPVSTHTFSPSVNMFDLIARLFCHLAKVRHATLVCKFTTWPQEILPPFTQISTYVLLPLHLHKVLLCAVTSQLCYSPFDFFFLKFEH